MKALSIRQPWLEAILRPPSREQPSPKRTENRTNRDGSAGQPCSHRGPMLIHASSGMTAAELSSALDMWRAARLITASAARGILATRSALLRGGIVGYCRALGHLRPDGTAAVIADDGEPRTMSAAEVRRRFDLRWWGGGHALLLTDVEALPFVPCSGALNMWQVPADVLQQLEAAGRKFDRYGNLLYRTRVRGCERWVTILRDERIAS